MAQLRTTSTQEPIRLALIALALVLVYFVAGRFGLSLATVNDSTSAIWPPTGIALAALLIFGLDVWPGVFIGALLVNLTTSDSVPASVLIAVGNTLEAVLGAYLVRRFAQGRRAFEHVLDIGKFALFAGALTTLVSATIGTIALALNGLASWADFDRIWLTWWFGDATGALIVTPALLLWANSANGWTVARALEAVASLVALVFVCLLVFGGETIFGTQNYPVAYFVLPALVWIAFRFGPRETATAIVVLAGIALWGTLRGYGPFAVFVFPSNQAFTLLQGFVCVFGLTCLSLASVVEQRRYIQEALRASDEQYRIMTRTATDVIVTIDNRGVIRFLNAAVEKVLGYRVSELLGRNITTLMPPRLRDRHKTSFARYQETGERNISWTGAELPGLHKDGHEVPLSISFGEFKHGKTHLFIGVLRDDTVRRHAEDQLRSMALIVDSSNEGIISVDSRGIVRSWNPGAERIYGYSADEMIGQSVACVTPPERAGETQQFLERLRRGERIEAETVRLRKNGERFEVALSISPITDAAGVMVGAATIAHDITERKRIEQQQQWLATIVDSSSDAIIGKSVDGTILSWNRGAEEIYGYTAAEALGQSISMLAAPEHADELPQVLEKIRSGELVHDFEIVRRRKDGRLITVSLTISPIRDANGAIQGASTIARDITERKRVEDQIRHMAQHDALTGLPNRVLFRDRIGQAIVHAHRQHEQFAVLFLDLDGFKHINDSLGHDVGDEMLRQTAQRLQQCLRADDTVARLGGDEFIICLPALTDGADAMPTATKVLEALREPFAVGRHTLHVGGSIGISIYPTDGTDAEALMRAADTAMYHAKENGRNNYQFFTARLNEAARRRLSVANLLHQAVERSEFSLCFQPQIDLTTGRISAAEALIRWRRRDLGIVAPAEFIKIAEETGLIVPIGEWALRTACQQLKAWRERGYPELRMTVNLSPQQFRRAGFPDTAARILAESEVPAAALDLEITESVLMTQTEENLAVLEQLAGMGIHMAVDDFGIGYSNLAYLQRFPIHTLKIDRSFVRGIGRDPNDSALVRAIIALAHSLRLEVIGEGVENADQAAFLKAHGCRSAQGYYFSRAVPAETFGELLRGPPHVAAGGMSEYLSH